VSSQLLGTKVSKSDRLRGALTGFTGVVTFFAGESAAHGHWILFVGLLVLQAVVWLAVAIAEV
jgi:hypothetical protein